MNEAYLASAPTKNCVWAVTKYMYFLPIMTRIPIKLFSISSSKISTLLHVTKDDPTLITVLCKYQYINMFIGIHFIGLN